MSEIKDLLYDENISPVQYQVYIDEVKQKVLIEAKYLSDVYKELKDRNLPMPDTFRNYIESQDLGY